MSYTKTPWSVTTVETSCGICHKVGPFPKKDIGGLEGQSTTSACVYVDYPSGASNPVEVELAANVVLMSAAPDLLEALESAKNGLEWYHDKYPGDVNESDHEAMMKIDLAIEKATKKMEI